MFSKDDGHLIVNIPSELSFIIASAYNERYR